FESLVKLLAFVAVGLFVTYEVYHGVDDLFANARANEHLARLMDWKQSVNPWDWGWLMVISMFAVLFLPRQFHMAVVENTDPVHVDKATWLFPLYLLIINLFVLPVAFAGHLHFHASGVDADTYVLGLPLLYGKQALALLVFIGGLSASTSMVIVATIALSIMVSNNIVMPLLLRPALLKESSAADLSPRLRLIRRLLILLILFTAYLYFHLIGGRTPLVSIGLISFVAVSQFAPAIIGGLFWKGATRAGAIAGLLGGFLVWAFCLPFPSLVEAGFLPQSILNEGLMGIHLLRPYAFLGLEGMDHISHAAFWSLLVNSLLYAGVSLYSRDPAIGRSQANLFVNISKYVGIDAETPVWRGKAFLQDIRLLLHRFLGPERGEALLVTYAHSNRIHLEKTVEASAELVSYAERLLAGAVGSSSARLLVASVVKEE
ncbi:MAG: histidine kinase, partial [Bacteroidetes bacterium]